MKLKNNLQLCAGMLTFDIINFTVYINIMDKIYWIYVQKKLFSLLCIEQSKELFIAFLQNIPLMTALIQCALGPSDTWPCLHVLITLNRIIQDY